MAQVTPKELTEFLLHDLEENKFIVFVWGPPGVGKSSIVMQCAQRLNLSVYPLSVALEHPHALGGFPAINWRERTVAKLPPSYMRHLDNCVLFLDDFAASDPSQQRIALSLTTYRRIGDAQLPPTTRIVLASNRVEDLSYIVRPSLAVMNRMKHYTLNPSLQDWVEYMRASCDALSILPSLLDYAIAYLSLFPHHFCVFPSDMHGASVVYPTPRTWTMLLQDLSSLARKGIITIPATTSSAQRAVQITCEAFLGEISKDFSVFLCVNTDDDVFSDYDALRAKPPHEQARYALAIAALRGASELPKIIDCISPEAAAILSFLVRATDAVTDENKMLIALKSLNRRRKK
ncbi:MAG: ATP-binding protein [Ignisphaera sp.]